MAEWFLIYDGQYDFYTKGHISEKSWKPKIDACIGMLENPTITDWWEKRQAPLSGEFREYIESIRDSLDHSWEHQVISSWRKSPHRCAGYTRRSFTSRCVAAAQKAVRQPVSPLPAIARRASSQRSRAEARVVSQSAQEIVQAYFSRIRARDPGVADLFQPDAELIGLGEIKSGRDVIREFYAGVIRNAGPTPELVGELLLSANRVAAEIRISLDNGDSVHAVDLFVVEDGLIRSLTYFLSNY